MHFQTFLQLSFTKWVEFLLLLEHIVHYDCHFAYLVPRRLSLGMPEFIEKLSMGDSRSD